MTRPLAALFFLCAFAFTPALNAQHSSGGHSSGGHSHSSKSRAHSSKSKTKSGAVSHGYTYRKGHMASGYTPHSSVTRDSHGRIKRSRAAKDAFERQQPCPSTGKTHGACRGYVVDHVRPLECGGADAPSNMQWQTVAAGKAKDKTEGSCRQ
jgi:hypothetical protein